MAPPEAERNSCMPAIHKKREAQISLRVTAEQKDLINRAAMLETGGDLTRFVADAAYKAAKQTIQEHGISQLTNDMRERFYDVLINPPRPSVELIALACAPVPDGFELVV